jgi:hypothetical protein
MSELAEEGLRSRAAKRAEWASRALRASGDDLDAVGASSAAEVLYEQADRLDRLAGEVADLAKAAA